MSEHAVAAPHTAAESAARSQACYRNFDLEPSFEAGHIEIEADYRYPVFAPE